MLRITYLNGQRISFAVSQAFRRAYIRLCIQAAVDGRLPDLEGWGTVVVPWSSQQVRQISTPSSGWRPK